MNIKLHPLVKKTKTELLRLDTVPNLSWEEQKKYRSEFLPISVEPKLRGRALRFMDALIKLLEENGHYIKFEYNECHIEMYGQLTEIFLRQKYFRRRVKNDSGYSSDSYEKSNKLEFQIGSYDRKSWIDRKTKKLEDYLPVIYTKIEEKSKWWADLRRKQKIEREEREKQEVIEAEKQKLKALEEEKITKLITDAKNHKTAIEVRIYLKALEDQMCENSKFNNSSIKEYLKWGHAKANEIDPTITKSESV